MLSTWFLKGKADHYPTCALKGLQFQGYKDASALTCLFGAPRMGGGGRNLNKHHSGQDKCNAEVHAARCIPQEIWSEGKGLLSPL